MGTPLPYGPGSPKIVAIKACKDPSTPPYRRCKSLIGRPKFSQELPVKGSCTIYKILINGQDPNLVNVHSWDPMGP